MDDETVLAYLEGRSPDLEAAHQQLVREGPPVIVPVLRLTPSVLRTVGAELGELLVAIEAGRQNFDKEMVAGRPVDEVFFRTRKIIESIVRVSPKQAEEAGTTIERLLLPASRMDRRKKQSASSPNLGVLAAIHSATKGIPRHSVMAGLMMASDIQDSPLVRCAVSAGMLGFDLPPRVSEAAIKEIAQFTRGFVYNFMPALVLRLKNEYLPGEKEQSEIELLIAKLAIYYMVVFHMRSGVMYPEDY